MLGQASQVDVVVKEPGEAEYRVVLEVLGSEWARSNAIWLLEEKLNAYAGFILDGHMRSLYPASTLETTRLVVASVDRIPPEALDLLNKAAPVFARIGIRLTWDAEGGLPPEGTPPPRQSSA